MAAITRKQVDRQFELFCQHVPAPDGLQWALEANSPGDGVTRYRLGTTTGAPRWIGAHGPIDPGVWRGSREAYEALHAMWRTAQYLNGRAEEATRAAVMNHIHGR